MEEDIGDFCDALRHKIWTTPDNELPEPLRELKMLYRIARERNELLKRLNNDLVHVRGKNGVIYATKGESFKEE